MAFVKYQKSESLTAVKKTELEKTAGSKPVLNPEKDFQTGPPPKQ